MEEKEITIEDMEALLKKAERMEKKCDDLINEQEKILLSDEDEILAKIAKTTEELEWNYDKIKNEHKFTECI